MKKYIDQFIDFLKEEQGVSPHTLRAYTIDLKEFSVFLDEEPEDIDYLDIRSYIASLHHRNLKQ